MENTVSGAVSQKEPTAKYEENFQKKYAGKDISGSEAQKIIDGISEENKEKYGFSENSISFSGAFGGRVNAGGTTYYIIDTKTEKGEKVDTIDIGIGLGTPSLGTSTSMVILPHANSSKDIEGHSIAIGGSYSLFSGEVLFDNKGNFSGLKYSGISISPKSFPNAEGHGSIDSSIIKGVKEISTNKKIIKITKEIESLSSNPTDTMINIIKINSLSNELLNEIKKLNKKGGEADNKTLHYQKIKYGL